MQYLRATHHVTNAYSPSESGLIERLHHLIKRVSEHTRAPNEWFYKLSMTLLAMWNSAHQEINFSPSQAVFGHMILLPGTLTEEASGTYREASPKFVTSFTDHNQKLPLFV